MTKIASRTQFELWKAGLIIESALNNLEPTSLTVLNNLIINYFEIVGGFNEFISPEIRNKKMTTFLEKDKNSLGDAGLAELYDYLINPVCLIGVKTISLTNKEMFLLRTIAINLVIIELLDSSKEKLKNDIKKLNEILLQEESDTQSHPGIICWTAAGGSVFFGLIFVYAVWLQKMLGVENTPPAQQVTKFAYYAIPLFILTPIVSLSAYYAMPFFRSAHKISQYALSKIYSCNQEALAFFQAKSVRKNLKATC